MARTSLNNKRNQKYEVILKDEQIAFLKAFLSMEETTLTIKKRALILLALHKASGKPLTHRQIAESLDISTSTVHCTIKRFVNQGYDQYLTLRRSPSWGVLSSVIFSLWTEKPPWTVKSRFWRWVV